MLVEEEEGEIGDDDGYTEILRFRNFGHRAGVCRCQFLFLNFILFFFYTLSYRNETGGWGRGGWAGEVEDDDGYTKISRFRNSGRRAGIWRWLVSFVGYLFDMNFWFQCTIWRPDTPSKVVKCGVINHWLSFWVSLSLFLSLSLGYYRSSVV